MSKDWSAQPMLDYAIRTIESQLIRCLERDDFAGVATWGEIHLQLSYKAEDE